MDQYNRSSLNQLASITLFTLENMLQNNKNLPKKEGNKWGKFDSHFKSAVNDTGFKPWVIKGITAWCSLEKDGGAGEFSEYER